MLLIIEKRIRGGIFLSIHRHAKANNKYVMIYYDNNNKSSNLKYNWAVSQKLPVNNFQWIEDISQFNEEFIKSFNEESDEEYFLEVDVQYTEKLHTFYNNLSFLPKKMKN